MDGSTKGSSSVRVSVGVALAVLVAGGVYWRVQHGGQPEPAGRVLVAAAAPEAAPGEASEPDIVAPAESSPPAAVHDGAGPGRKGSDGGPAPPDRDAATAGGEDAGGGGPAQDAAAPVGAGAPDLAAAQTGSGTDPAAGEGEATVLAQPQQSYTWHDGDRTLTVWLEPDLALRPDGDGITSDDIVSTEGQLQSTVTVDGYLRDLPVFRSDEGRLMALPGGVSLVLDPSLDASAVATFFEFNGIAAGRTTALDYVTNGYFIETEPGFASLLLANDLAVQSNVVLSSPNWWSEVDLE